MQKKYSLLLYSKIQFLFEDSVRNKHGRKSFTTNKCLNKEISIYSISYLRPTGGIQPTPDSIYLANIMKKHRPLIFPPSILFDVS